MLYGYESIILKALSKIFIKHLRFNVRTTLCPWMKSENYMIMQDGG